MQNDAKKVEAVFDHMATGQWMYERNQESLSGPGSTVRYTEHFRRALLKFVVLSRSKSILDAPCGDFNWMKELNFPSGTNYIGADIVDVLVETNRRKYASDNRLFIKIDLTRDIFPDADMWLCRDCLFHLSFDHAVAVLENSLRSTFKYYLLTSHYNESNVDIETGGFRELNLCKEPFKLPEPLGSITDFIEDFPPRRVGIWSRDQVLGAMITG